MKRPLTTHLSYGKQRGLSLIELMIAMVIGLILILGVTQIFINNQKSYLFQQSQVGNQENSRFALAILNQELAKAGYRGNPTQLLTSGSGQNCTFAEGASVVAVSSTSFCLRYQAATKSDVNCLGSPLSGTDQATIVLPYRQVNPIVVEKIAFDPNTNSITCTTGTTTQPLVTGVAAVNFEYGAGDTGLKTVSAYGKSPTGIIGAVRYTILMQSPSSAGSIRDSAAQSAALKEWNSRFSVSLTDTNQIYQLVQGTTMVRNQMQ